MQKVSKIFASLLTICLLCTRYHLLQQNPTPAFAVQVIDVEVRIWTSNIGIGF